MAQIYYFKNEWLDTPPKLTGPSDQAFWMASAVFDGSRVLNGLAPVFERARKRYFKFAVTQPV